MKAKLRGVLETLLVIVILLMRKSSTCFPKKIKPRCKKTSEGGILLMKAPEQRVLVVFPHAPNQMHEFPHILRKLSDFIGIAPNIRPYAFTDALDSIRSTIRSTKPTHIILAGPGLTGGLKSDLLTNSFCRSSAVVLALLWDAKVKRSVICASLSSAKNFLVVSATAEFDTITKLYGQRAASITPFFDFLVDSSHPLLKDRFAPLVSRGISALIPGKPTPQRIQITDAVMRLFGIQPASNIKLSTSFIPTEAGYYAELLNTILCVNIPSGAYEPGFIRNFPWTIAMGPRIPMEITGRVAHALAAKCVLVTQRSPVLDSFLEDGKDYLGFSKVEEIPQLLEKYLNNPDWVYLQSVADSGHSRLMEEIHENKSYEKINKVLITRGLEPLGKNVKAFIALAPHDVFSSLT